MEDNKPKTRIIDGRKCEDLDFDYGKAIEQIQRMIKKTFNAYHKDDINFAQKILLLTLVQTIAADIEFNKKEREIIDEFEKALKEQDQFQGCYNSGSYNLQEEKYLIFACGMFQRWTTAFTKFIDLITEDQFIKDLKQKRMHLSEISKKLLEFKAKKTNGQ